MKEQILIATLGSGPQVVTLAIDLLEAQFTSIYGKLYEWARISGRHPGEPGGAGLRICTLFFENLLSPWRERLGEGEILIVDDSQKQWETVLMTSVARNS